MFLTRMSNQSLHLPLAIPTTKRREPLGDFVAQCNVPKLQDDKEDLQLLKIKWSGNTFLNKYNTSISLLVGALPITHFFWL